MQCFKIFQNRHFILFYFGTALNVLVGNVTAMQFIPMLVIAVVQALQYIRPGNVSKNKDAVWKVRKSRFSKISRYQMNWPQNRSCKS